MLILLLISALCLFGAGCLGGNAEDDLDPNVNLEEGSWVIEQNGNTEIHKSISNNLTDQAHASYPFQTGSNADCGNKMAIAGTVKLEKFGKSEVPKYVVKFDLTSKEPVTYDRVKIDFDIGNSSYSLLVSESTNTTSDRVLKPKEKDSLQVDTSNRALRLLNLSSMNRIALHVSVFNRGQAVGLFHAALPAIPGGISDGQTKTLVFEDFASVEKQVDENFSADYPQLADPAEYQRRMEARDAEAQRIMAMLPAEQTQATKNDLLRIDCLTKHGMSENGTDEYQLQLNLTPLQEVSYNVIVLRLDNGTSYRTGTVFVTDTRNGTLATCHAKPGEANFLYTERTGSVQELLAASPSGKLGLHISVYDDKQQLVGAEHAVLPTLFATGEQPAEMPLGESQTLKFDSFDNVSQKIDPNYKPN